jgi:hypothetical protein
VLALAGARCSAARRSALGGWELRLRASILSRTSTPRAAAPGAVVGVIAFANHQPDPQLPADRLIRMSRPDEEGLGVPLPHFTLKSVVAPDLQGVDAFDRPAVEEGKVLARQYHGEKASGGAQ